MTTQPVPLPNQPFASLLHALSDSWGLENPHTKNVFTNRTDILKSLVELAVLADQAMTEVGPTLAEGDAPVWDHLYIALQHFKQILPAWDPNPAPENVFARLRRYQALGAESLPVFSEEAAAYVSLIEAVQTDYGSFSRRSGTDLAFLRLTDYFADFGTSERQGTESVYSRLHRYLADGLTTMPFSLSDLSLLQDLVEQARQEINPANPASPALLAALAAFSEPNPPTAKQGRSL